MRKSMDRICQHCGQLFVGNAYRVTSEEEGIAGSKETSARNRGSHRPRLGI